MAVAIKLHLIDFEYLIGTDDGLPSCNHGIELYQFDFLFKVLRRGGLELAGGTCIYEASVPIKWDIETVEYWLWTSNDASNL